MQKKEINRMVNEWKRDIDTKISTILESYKNARYDEINDLLRRNRLGELEFYEKAVKEDGYSPKSLITIVVNGAKISGG